MYIASASTKVYVLDILESADLVCSMHVLFLGKSSVHFPYIRVLVKLHGRDIKLLLPANRVHTHGNEIQTLYI